jgi:WD repeat and SOF domain-containing protein 1
VISRSADSCIRERSNDSFIVRKNPDPLLHPFQKAREYTRALNAVKVDRILAKPFLGALSGHKDGVYCMAKHPTSLSHLISGSADGEIILWNVSTQKSVVQVPAHTSFVRGLSLVPHTLNFVSCSDDKSIKMWSADLDSCLDNGPVKVCFSYIFLIYFDIF